MTGRKYIYTVIIMIAAISCLACGCNKADRDERSFDTLPMNQEKPVDNTEITKASEIRITVDAIDNLPGDFIGGVDISSYLSEKNSGVKYYDFDGNELNNEEFFVFLAECGINYVRIRVWNDPYDKNGMGYGGGNNDLEAAIAMGKWATDAGMRVLIDFHYSDFWADPSKQQVPKAWEGLSADEKVKESRKYVKASLNTLLDEGVDVGMVQIGNEINNAIAGEKNWSGTMLDIIKNGCEAVTEINAERNKEILSVIHFANPEKMEYGEFAERLDEAGVKYDVFASSYYPYWHGSLENLKNQLEAVAVTYNKKVMVAETSWAYTLDDGDGSGNTVSRYNNSKNMPYEFSVYGQAEQLCDLIRTVADTANGIGVFYWEAAWIPVNVYSEGTGDGNRILEENKKIWDKYGSGWASSYAAEYDPYDAGKWYGGSAVDNQALFDFYGYPLDTLNIFRYVKTGTGMPR